MSMLCLTSTHDISCCLISLAANNIMNTYCKFCLSKGFYCCNKNTMTKSKLGRKGFVSASCPQAHTSSPWEVRAGAEVKPRGNAAY